MSKIPFKKLASRLSGISTPFGGVSWATEESHADVAKRLVTFLEDRRALYRPFEGEQYLHVAQSVLEIRRVITDLLPKVPRDSVIGSSMLAMRAACRKYLDSSGSESYYFHLTNAQVLALGELRGVFGIHIARVCLTYCIDVEDDLASILPPQAAEGLSLHIAAVVLSILARCNLETGLPSSQLERKLLNTLEEPPDEDHLLSTLHELCDMEILNMEGDSILIHPRYRQHMKDIVSMKAGSGISLDEAIYRLLNDSFRRT